MVSTVADALFHRLIDAFPPDRAYGRDDYARDPMPDSIVRDLDRSLWSRLDGAAPRNDAWFDFDHPEVGSALREYLETLARHQRVPADDWTDVLRQACRSTISYLIQPVRTLPGLVFGRETEAEHVDEILARLNLLPAYSYFREVMEAYVDQKDVVRIDRARFERLLRRIDRQMTGDYDADDWLKLLQPLVRILKLMPDAGEGLPVDVLRTFFQERDANEVVARLDTRYTMKGLRFVEESGLQDLFLSQPDDEEVEEPLTEQVGRMVESAARSVQGDGPVPLWKQFERAPHPTTESAPTRSSRSSEIRGAESPSATTSDQPLWKQFRPEGDAGLRSSEPGRSVSEGPVPTRPRASDLTTLERTVLGERGARNRDLFLRHLFAGSRDEYERTLRQLETASSWTEASQIIAREVFLKHQVNIYSDPAVAFTDAAEAQYGS